METTTSDHKLMPMLLEKAAGEGYCTGDMSSWLVGHMNDLLDSTGVHLGLTCMFHIGRYSQASAFSRLWSSTCIAEFLIKFMKDGKAGETKEYPLSIFYEATSAFDENFHFHC